MDKKAKKKQMFVMKETLVHLTPHQMEQVQGATVMGTTVGGNPVEPPTQCYYTY